MTSATDELRRLLDERGVEWRPIAWNPKKETFYYTSDGVGFCADEYVDGVKIYTDAIIAPEQAVAATLGRGTCHAVFEVDAMSEDERIGEFVCSECGETFGDVRDQLPHYCPACGKRVVE